VSEDEPSGNGGRPNRYSAGIHRDERGKGKERNAQNLGLPKRGPRRSRKLGEGGGVKKFRQSIIRPEGQLIVGGTTGGGAGVGGKQKSGRQGKNADGKGGGSDESKKIFYFMTSNERGRTTGPEGLNMGERKFEVH